MTSDSPPVTGSHTVAVTSPPNSSHRHRTVRALRHTGFAAALVSLSTLSATSTYPAHFNALTWICLCLVSVAWTAFAFCSASPK